MGRQSTLFVLGSALAVVACGGKGADGKVDRFVQGCLSSTNLERSFCECAGENAHDELSEDGFAFLTATLNEDQEDVATLREKLDLTEALAAGMFMVNAYKKCAQPTE